ncbi:MAG: hypothetical protein QY318_04365 [Candidatus Dojkabacteria bacterium]|nr:MAG: hypothetical protein QY318_04365 [Candidatus Dojkabacteria bacterium]
MQTERGKRLAYKITLTALLFLAIITLARPAHSREQIDNLVDQGIEQGKEAVSDLKERLQRVNNYFLIGRDLEINTDVNGNLIVFSNSVDFEGNINGGMLIFAKEVTIKGKVSDNLWLFAREVDLDGDIDGTARIFTTSLNLKGNIAGNLFAITSESTFDGNVTGRVIVIGKNVGVDSEDLKGRFYILYKRPKSGDN